ncbi:hypothetical protein EXIGLDRAFT_840415 [Exidia glandulosa HHB12029]|uniref:Uncharacterized protein n=1 Tax=Exidia glandulosa HHB12029 TaxID=1314781 RepID=A0A165EG09_EXIGL|nr:hypothetical protein EXIGLDRAFT_840415 [Exidia glandulosa HHB12029]
MSYALDYATNAYFAVSVSSSSSYISDPAPLADAHPSLFYVGKVGALNDVLLLGAPQSDSDVAKRALNALSDVESVDVQVPAQRPEEDVVTRHRYSVGMLGAPKSDVDAV